MLYIFTKKKNHFGSQKFYFVAQQMKLKLNKPGILNPIKIKHYQTDTFIKIEWTKFVLDDEIYWKSVKE